jgi:two-component system, OmpR family, response regulator
MGMGTREVLVVDDEDGVRRVVCLMLSAHGLGVREAAGGREAVDTYRGHRGTVGLVLLDVRMPGLDGPQTLALLREVDPAVRCCFLTGGSGDYSAADLLALRALRVFTKPVPSFADLARTLEGILSRQDAAGR